MKVTAARLSLFKAQSNFRGKRGNTHAAPSTVNSNPTRSAKLNKVLADMAEGKDVGIPDWYRSLYRFRGSNAQAFASRNFGIEHHNWIALGQVTGTNRPGTSQDKEIREVEHCFRTANRSYISRSKITLSTNRLCPSRLQRQRCMIFRHGPGSWIFTFKMSKRMFDSWIPIYWRW